MRMIATSSWLARRSMVARAVLLGVGLAVHAGSAPANTSTVFGPGVDAGARALEYRLSLEPEDDGDAEVFTHRLHYQQAFNDSWRGRVIVNQRAVGGGDLDVRYSRLELQWQFLESETHGWDSALRYEIQVATQGGNPDRFRLAWTGSVDVTQRWQLRGNFLTGHEFGANADDGLLMEARAQASYALRDSLRLGVEVFSDLNTTANPGGFDEQEHQLGPILKAGLGRGWSLNAGYLRGISAAAPDDTFRLMAEFEF